MSLVLDGESLTIAALARVAEDAPHVELAPAARVRMSRARAVVEEVMGSGEIVYGLTTGVAERKRTAY